MCILEDVLTSSSPTSTCLTITDCKRYTFTYIFFHDSDNYHFKTHVSSVFGGRKDTCCFAAGKMVQTKTTSILQVVCNPKARMGMLWNTAEQYPHKTGRWSIIWPTQLEFFVNYPQNIAGL